MYRLHRNADAVLDKISLYAFVFASATTTGNTIYRASMEN